MALDEYSADLRKALDGLTPQERRFQPGPDSHHIDFTIWHMARVEDNWVLRFGRQAETVWERDGWAQRLGLPEQGSGFGYTAEQVTGLPDFDLDLLTEYADSVRAATLDFLDSLSQEDLDRCPDPKRPENSIGRMLSHVIVEESQHVGQIAYIRGIQRGINK
ncbi:MAG: DinB family protein [Chloroflexi bacterium]|nr:DinB family protein [Chloroflexota bacterium]